MEFDAIVRCGYERARMWGTFVLRCRSLIGACLILNAAGEHRVSPVAARHGHGHRLDGGTAADG